MKLLIRWLIEWPGQVPQHLTWLAPLFARITVGWVFMWSGWASYRFSSNNGEFCRVGNPAAAGARALRVRC